MPNFPGIQTTLSREQNTATVLDALRAAPRQTRAELATATGLSKPTVATALRVLGDGGLVRERGRSTGRRGPSALLYEPVAEAAFVIGVDIGAHHVRALSADLDGGPLAETEQPVDGSTIAHLLAAIRTVHERLGGDAAEMTVIGAPGVVDPAGGQIRSAPSIPSWEGLQAETVIGNTLDAAVIVENDVNLAALGELAAGAGNGRNSFAYLKVGSGLGCGLVLDRQLHRGHHGAAGEIGYLAVGPDPLAEALAGADVNRGAMERRLSQAAVIELAGTLDPALSPDPQAIFEAARHGRQSARTIVDRTAQALALCIASITAVLDLELVLLGGGIGAQTDLLLHPTLAATRALVPFAPEIALGRLGERAVLLGAAAVAAEHARKRLVSRSVQAARETT